MGAEGVVGRLRVVNRQAALIAYDYDDLVETRDLVDSLSTTSTRPRNSPRRCVVDWVGLRPTLSPRSTFPQTSRAALSKQIRFHRLQ